MPESDCGDKNRGSEPRAVAERWVAALRERDLDGAADCFAIEYHDEAPARPGESVDGRDAVRRNFAELFSELPDLEAENLRAVSDGSILWMEWRMRGTRRDGSSMEFVGVNIFEVAVGCFRRGWIYTELTRPVGGLDAQMKRMTRGGE